MQNTLPVLVFFCFLLLTEHAKAGMKEKVIA